VRTVTGSFIVLAVGVFANGCSGSSGSESDTTQGVGGTSIGGAVNTSHVSTIGGATSSTFAVSSGGATSSSSALTVGGATQTGGRSGSGGASSVIGGSSLGGSTAAGGTTETAGGSSATGGSTSSTGGASSTSGSTSVGGAGDAKPSSGCGKTPTLKNSPSAANQNTLTSSGKSRQYLIRWPDNYDKSHPYRLIIGLHGATGKDTDIGPSYFGLFALSNNSTIFVAPSADGGLWSAATDTTFVDDILKAVEADLCIDTSRVMLEGFSQGAAMSWTLACSRPGVFRAAVGHSGGGVANPSTCQPIPYLGSLGLAEGNGQNTQTDQFAKWNGCTITTLPRASTGSHVCTNYTGCPAADPVRWCSYDGGHTPSPTDSGQSASWMPKEVWAFLSQF
jgi:poly(3-hydroxybutyrate) depolymerase